MCAEQSSRKQLAMAAPKGHAKWGNPIKPKSYQPEELWIGAMAYFDWCDSHPWKKKEVLKSGEKVGKLINVPTQRPYSIEGLCNALDIDKQTFLNYEKKAGYETYFDVCSRIRQTIDNQHFEGGMVGSFNANIVTRKLGLAEKQELTGKDGKDLIPELKIIIDTSAKQNFASNERDID